MNVLEREDHLLKTKLVFKSTDEFTDEQAERVFLDTKVESEADLEELVHYLAQYRPNLLQRLNNALG